MDCKCGMEWKEQYNDKCPRCGVSAASDCYANFPWKGESMRDEKMELLEGRMISAKQEYLSYLAEVFSVGCRVTVRLDGEYVNGLVKDITQNCKVGFVEEESGEYLRFKPSIDTWQFA